MSSSKKPKHTADDVEPSSALEKAKNTLEGLVVEYDDDYVVIRDKYPKARSATLTLRITTHD
jgi:hypothetical protein